MAGGVDNMVRFFSVEARCVRFLEVFLLSVSVHQIDAFLCTPVKYDHFFHLLVILLVVLEFGDSLGLYPLCLLAKEKKFLRKD